MIKKVATDQAPAAIGPYVQGNIVNGLLFASGQIPINPATGNVDANDIEGQTKQVMENVKAILKEVGADFNAVVKTTCFLTDMANFATFNEIYGSYFTDALPARSCVGITKLPKDVLVEVEFIAEVKA